MTRQGALVLLLTLLVGPGAEARELWRRGGSSLELTGSLREVATFGDGTSGEAFQTLAAEAVPPSSCLLAAEFADCPGFEAVGEEHVFESLTRLRLRFDLVWSPRLSATLVYDQQFRTGDLDRLESVLTPADEEDTFLGLEDEIHLFGLEDEANRHRWSHRAYRAYVHWDGDRVELTVGRQRIAWGVGRLWNPIDRFNAIPPLAIEGDESPGVDAVDLRWRLSGFSYLQAVYAPGTRSDDARYAFRFHGVLKDTDVSLVAGVFEEARTFGLDLARNLGDAAVRLEAVYTNPERKIWPIDEPRPGELDRFWQIVVSADYQFDVGSGLYVLVEHLYNGNALGFGAGRAGPLLPFFEASERPPETLASDLAAALSGPFVQPASSARFGGSRVVTSSRHTTGLELGYEVSTALRADLLSLYDWNGESAVFSPSLTFTGLNAMDVTLGAQVFTGSRSSQFGGRDALVYLLAEAFF